MSNAPPESLAEAPAARGEAARPVALPEGEGAATVGSEFPRPLFAVDARGALLALLTTLVGIYALHWASAVVVPFLLGLLLSYALSPGVDRLQRWRMPRPLGATVVLLALLGGVGSTVYALADDAAALVESMPDAAQKLRQSLRASRGAPQGAIDKVQKAATNLEQAAEESTAAPPPASRGVQRVQIEKARFNVRDYLWSGTIGLAAFAGQMTVVVFLAFFLLASGDTFRRKLVRIAGPSWARKRVTVQVLDEITAQIKRYLLVQILLSMLVGLATWAALAALGLERAAVWGVAAAILNFVPYIGSLIVAAGTALVAFLQFGNLGMAAAVAAVSIVIHTISGNLLTPWLTARTSRISPVAAFVGVLAFGWLWGIWGLLIGAPVLMAVKAVCDHVEQLQPLGELLGD